jgi:hypothetical protein
MDCAGEFAGGNDRNVKKQKSEKGRPKFLQLVFMARSPQQSAKK